ncbi:unnamed protein product [marine sediment metagenome]|uniref:Uncharacterized protein n=1 Tax=marine sediment metagenome TaxID=412755 RepID=X1R630_9ZZZZ
MAKPSKEFLEEYYSKDRQDFIDNNFFELQNILVEIRKIQKRFKTQDDASSPLSFELTLMLNPERYEKAKAIVNKRIGQNFKAQQDFINNNFFELQNILVEIRKIQKRFKTQHDALSPLSFEIMLILSYKFDEKTESFIDSTIGVNSN